jgi:hypothetical protein
MTGGNKSSRQAHWVEDESIPDVFLEYARRARGALPLAP